MPTPARTVTINAPVRQTRAQAAAMDLLLNQSGTPVVEQPRGHVSSVPQDLSQALDGNLSDEYINDQLRLEEGEARSRAVSTLERNTLENKGFDF